MNSLYFVFNNLSSQPEAWGLDFRRNGQIVKTAFGQYSTELFTSEAENIIANHNQSEVKTFHFKLWFYVNFFVYFQPLFMYVAQQAVHSANPYTGDAELEAPYKYYEKFSHIKNEKRRKYAGILLPRYF